jgi:hypothetical protein
MSIVNIYRVNFHTSLGHKDYQSQDTVLIAAASLNAVTAATLIKANYLNPNTQTLDGRNVIVDSITAETTNVLS